MIDNYDIIAELGKGQFGLVSAAIDKRTNKMVVIKAIEKLPPGIRVNAQIIAQLRMLRAVKDFEIPAYLGCIHKNIVCVLEGFQDDKYVYIVSEYIPNTMTLDKYSPDLETPEGQLELLNIFQQLADGLAYMHSKGIIHHDIKTKNILLKGDIPFYIDFDLSCSFGPDVLPQYACKYNRLDGTHNYLAPEMVLREAKSFAPSDVYALGIVFYRMLTQSLPFQRDTIEETHEAILNDEVPSFEAWNPYLEDLVFQMLSKSPQDRPRADQVREVLNELIKAA